MEEFYEVISNCENILYRGFSTTKSSDSDWLNKCCGCLSELLRQLQIKILEPRNEKQIIHTILLCLMQIVTGIKFMEKVTEIESNKNLVLNESRQFFLDEILKSLQKLKEVARNIEKNANFPENPTLNECIDTVLEILEPICAFEDDNENIAQRNANAMISVAKIKPVLESIVAHSLEFANFCKDKQPISVICKKVLKECDALEAECSLSDSKNPPNDTNRRLKAGLLETAIYQLENLINDELLRLVFETFKDLKAFKIKDLHENCEYSQDLIDSILDRLFQIGQFGIMFADEIKISAQIQLSLTSFEAVELHLCPEILKKYQKDHVNLLDTYWNEQITFFQLCIQRIIDTSAFCLIFEDIIQSCVKKLNENFDQNEISDILAKADVLEDHFRVNLSEDFTHLLNDFKLMVKETHAGLKHLNDNDSKRLIKRLKILKTTVKKIREGLQSQKGHVDTMKDEKPKFCNEIELLPDVEELIIVEEKSIKVNNSVSLRKPRQIIKSIDPNVSNIIYENRNNSTRNTKLSKRRTSFRRVALRNIEKILENITNVSSTFNKTRSASSNIDVSKSNKVRIHIIGDV
uniref:CSON005790 protein n=1 Tax=Culicoides sonorensis TaxID=179676 RepID=A0A336LYB3_CULSO